jgi:hypothetical protein
MALNLFASNIRRLKVNMMLSIYILVLNTYIMSTKTLEIYGAQHLCLILNAYLLSTYV